SSAAAFDLVHQVRLAHVDGEYEDSGEQVAGFGAECAVGHFEREVFRGVARGVAGADGDVAQGDLVAVVQVCGRETVLPVLAAFAGNVGRGSGGRGQFAGAGEEVGMHVGLGDGGDAHSLAVRQLQVFGDVATGVEYERDAAGLTADEVARLGQVLVVDAFQVHQGSSLRD